MKLDDLLEPTAEDPPCGPDLERTDDGAFLDYYYDAESRLPERYFLPGSDQDGREDRLFDPRSVVLASETGTILDLLTRSRDLRLLSLLAQFQILAMRLEEFVDTVEVMAAILTQWPDEVHPRLDRGSADRRGALEALASPTTVIMPLTHLSLLPGADVSLRRHLVAAGKQAPRLSEAELKGQDVLAPLRADGSLRALSALHDLLCRASDAVTRLQRQSSSMPGGFTPELAPLRQVLADLQAMIAQARPELRIWSERPPAPEPAGVTIPGDVQAGRAPVAQPVPGRVVADRMAARTSLELAQDWLAAHEPSSAALLLVVQARELVGMSLIDAIEILMPDRAPQMALHLGQGTGFVLPMQRLKQLSGQAVAKPPDSRKPVVTIAAVTSRADLVGLLSGVEGYFLANEPASPIPLLLSKARGMLEQRFDMIIAELLQPPVANG